MRCSRNTFRIVGQFGCAEDVDTLYISHDTDLDTFGRVKCHFGTGADEFIHTLLVVAEKERCTLGSDNSVAVGYLLFRTEQERLCLRKRRST